MRTKLVKNSCLLLCTFFSFSTANAMLLEDTEVPRQYLKPTEPTISPKLQWPDKIYCADDKVTFPDPRKFGEYSANVAQVFPCHKYPSYDGPYLVEYIYLGRGLKSVSADNNEIFLMVRLHTYHGYKDIGSRAVETVFTHLKELSFANTQEAFKDCDVSNYLKTKTENEYHLFHQHNYQDVHLTFASSDENAIGRFFSVFTNNKLIPDSVIDQLMTKNNMKIKIEDFEYDVNQLIRFINEEMEKKEAEGIRLTPTHLLNSALERLTQVTDPICRARITWHLIEQLHTSDYCDPSTLMQLCEQISDPSLPFFKEAKILQSDLQIAKHAPELNMDSRYLPAIHRLLDLEDEEAHRMRLTFANAYIGNDVPSTALKRLAFTKESIIDLLKLAQTQESRLKALEAELAILKGQQ